MSSTQVDAPVWKTGKTGNIQFANIKQLEKADPSVYKLMTWQEGFSTQDFNFEYRIGKSKWGLWLSRKPISVEALKAVATTLTSNEKESSQRTEQPTATINGTTKDQIQDRINQSHQENVQARNSNTQALKELTSAILILASAVNNKMI